MRTGRLVGALFGCALQAMACDHGVPYGLQAVPPNPIASAIPRRLTFSSDADWNPAWLPDGSAVGYSYRVIGRSDRDRCIGFLPPEGGRIMRSVCADAGRDPDSVNAVLAYGASAGGRLAVLHESGKPREIVPDWVRLSLGRLGDTTLHRVLNFPYTAPNGRLHLTARYLVWANESTLVFLATHTTYRPATIDIPADTVQNGIELVRLDLRGDSIAALSVIPGTLGASSVAPGPVGAVTFTMGGDSRVFSYDLAAGQRSTLYDFGSSGIARDAQLANGRLVAVVGGRVQFVPLDSVVGLPTQPDSGGPILSVQLAGGTVTHIADIEELAVPHSPTYRHLALSPSGHRLVSEVYQLTVRVLRFTTDTLVSKRSDLWLFEVP